MASNRQTVFNFLNVTESSLTIDRQNLEKIRSAYTNIKHGSSSTTDNPLKVVADEFMIADDAVNLEHLKICVSSNSIGIACQAIWSKYIDTLDPAEGNSEKRNHSPRTSVSAKPAVGIVVCEATCRILLKQNHTALIQFIEDFLLTAFDQNTSSTQKSNTRNDSSVSQGLPPGSVLDTFIRHQLSTRGEINVGRALSKLPLVNPITLVDEFDTWYFDHLHGLLELNLLPEEQTFPIRWKLAPDAKLSYRIETTEERDHRIEPKPRNVDRPSTASLERFVEDVCEKENNGMAAKWINALHEDDLFTYDHLANLKYIEWSDLRVLSLNGKKVLKSYVDREKQTTVDVKSTKDPVHQPTSKKSECELLAHIHQMKLYFHYILADEFQNARIPTPAKLNAQCVHLAFEEMHHDGFADDGLFDQMKSFFLPLTMVEEDLSIDDQRWRLLFEMRSVQRDDLLVEHQRLTKELMVKEDEYYRHDDAITTSIKNIMSNEDVRLVRMDSIEKHREDMNRLEEIRNNLRTKIQANQDLIDDIEKGLKTRDHSLRKEINRNLLKPNRGFIMYGPPGTGKSDIMRKVSTRIGINMVAPPIAAGELNRPLVGESERIISDISMRCHRLPYLMCCLSIDEIDSLTPKRRDDSRDGNIAKLSVLLSVIDGIKDVPNLMIFCATNRLHVIDEAFLRRMQGKFFVGRPSSRARKSILSEIKCWHMPPQLLESLTMATTNFSGSALRALCQSITAHCIDAERRNPDYKLDYRTMFQLADKTALDCRIFIGAETLPILLLRTADGQQPAIQFNDLPNIPHSFYTGKIIVNFYAKRIDIEMINIDRATGNHEKVVYQEFLFEYETKLQEIIPRLTAYGKSRNVQLLQIIDLNLLSNESAYDEKEKFEILKERLDECKAYRRSMIVYDLDSLIGVNRSEENSATGRSTNFSLINQNVYTYLKDKFQNAYIQSMTPTTTNDNEEKWAVMVIQDPFLLGQFRTDTNFTRSVKEIEEEKLEKHRANQTIKCVQCNDYFIVEENKMGVCLHHDGFVFDNHSSVLTQWSPQTAIEQLLKEEAKAVTEEQRERFQRDKERFKFICCYQTLQISDEIGGCKRNKHSPANTSQEQWEAACNQNREYQDKMSTLLAKRIQAES